MRLHSIRSLSARSSWLPAAQCSVLSAAHAEEHLVSSSGSTASPLTQVRINTSILLFVGVLICVCYLLRLDLKRPYLAGSWLRCPFLLVRSAVQ